MRCYLRPHTSSPSPFSLVQLARCRGHESAVRPTNDQACLNHSCGIASVISHKRGSCDVPLRYTCPSPRYLTVIVYSETKQFGWGRTVSFTMPPNKDGLVLRPRWSVRIESFDLLFEFHPATVTVVLEPETGGYLEQDRVLDNLGLE